jgi:hypothetical protein
VPWAELPYGAPHLNGKSISRAWTDEAWPHENGASYPAYRAAHSDPLLEARLAHLVRRREHLLARIHEVETRLAQQDRHLAHLQSGQLHFEEVRQMEDLRRAIDELDQRSARVEQAQRRREEMALLEREIAELRRNLGPSDVLREAASLLHRMTEGAYRDIRLQGHHQAWIEDRHGHAREYRELSRGTRDQVYLSLALAIVAAYRRRGIELPMALNDVFVNIDAERAQATAELLAQFASRGQQLILFTRHEHIMQRFAGLPAKLYTLRPRGRLDEPSREPSALPRALPSRPETFYLDQAPPVPLRMAGDAPPYRSAGPARDEPPYDWVAHWVPPQRTATAGADPEAFAVGPRQLLITEETPLADVDWLNPQAVARLQQLGIRHVRQFLELDPADGQQHMADPGITAASLYRWQSQLSLQCYVGLTANDAALLVACGVDDPEELSYSDVSQLHRRIEDYLSSAEARHRYGSIARFERSRLARWIQTARRSHFRRQRSSRSRPQPPTPRAAQPAGYRSEPAERLTPRTRRVDPLRTVKASEAVAAPPAEDRTEHLRFFLEPTDPIVDCPSIGPKTAERFHAIGVTSVAELLELDPADAATRINYRRITADLIRSWQLQTLLVCRVPNLRGHDAQLLVASEVPGPEQLAKMDAGTLFAQISELLETPEGKRILRSAKAPDEQEVAAWIRWAKSARQLQPA